MKKLILIYIFSLLSAMATETSLCIHLLNRTSFGIDTKGLSTCLKDSSYDASVCAAGLSVCLSVCQAVSISTYSHGKCRCAAGL